MLSFKKLLAPSIYTSLNSSSANNLTPEEIQFKAVSPLSQFAHFILIMSAETGNKEDIVSQVQL